MSRTVKVLIALFALLLAFGASSFAAAEYTARPSSCAGCHEMEPYYTSSYLKMKAFALREVYVHLTQQVKPPLAVTRDIPDESCLQCHESPGSMGFPTSSFDHEDHRDSRCIGCHERFVHQQVSPAANPEPAAMASCLTCHDGTGADDTCSLCHIAPHEPMGACDTCHSLDTWLPTDFDHPVPLTGGHADLECGTCHETGGAGETTTLGRAPERCVACHGDEHGGLQECRQCHTPAGWRPADFSHPYVGEHSPGSGDMSCGQCHPNGYGSSSCSPCHSGTPSED
jgi:hypothetical protein